MLVSNRAALGEQAGKEFAGKAESGAFVAAHRHQCSARFTPHGGRGRRFVAVAINDHWFIKVLSSEEGYAGFAHGHDGGCKVEDESTVVVGCRNGTTEGVRAESSIRAAVRRYKRIKLIDVHKVQTHHAGISALFAIGADAPKVTGVGNGVHADAVLLGAFDGCICGFEADALTISAVTGKLQNGSGILDETSRRIGFQTAVFLIEGIHGDHAHAVAVMTAKVGVC